MRSRTGMMFVSAIVAIATALTGAGPATASEGASFTEQSRSAGLTAAQAEKLQAKVDGYLLALEGSGRQVSPNQIDLGGATLNVAVPGEQRPRNLVRPASDAIDAAQCDGGADYKWFCAYQYEYTGGDNIGMYTCGTYYIPWYTTGSWQNNQTRGTRPLLTFVDGGTWTMPGAFAQQLTGVGWGPVLKIRNCTS